MATLHLMCGIAFAGKTTVARHLAHRLGCEYVSLDDINAERGLWGGDGIAVEEWERTHQIALERLTTLLADGKSVVLDDTNNLRWLRDRWRDLAHDSGHAVQLVYVDTPIDEARRRVERSRASHDRRLVTADVFQEHVDSFQPPEPDEEAVVVRPGDDLGGIVAWLRQLQATKHAVEDEPQAGCE